MRTLHEFNFLQVYIRTTSNAYSSATNYIYTAPEVLKSLEQ